jgi:predicted Zn-dependent protease
MQGATGVTRVSSNRGPVEVRLVAIDGGDGRIYRFLFATPANDTSRQAEALRQTALSFRHISEAEAARERPYRLQVRTARSGDSVARLARSMPEGPFTEARFRVLNGLALGAEPQPGTLVKTVVE